MDRHGGAVFPGKQKHAGIRNKDRVGTELLQLPEVGRGPVKVRVVGQDIGGDMDPDAPFVGVGDALCHLFPGKVAGLGPKSEGGAPDIDSVGPVVHGSPEDLQILCGDQELGLSFFYT